MVLILTLEEMKLYLQALTLTVNHGGGTSPNGREAMGAQRDRLQKLIATEEAAAARLAVVASKEPTHFALTPRETQTACGIDLRGPRTVYVFYKTPEKVTCEVCKAALAQPVPHD